MTQDKGIEFGGLWLVLEEVVCVSPWRTDSTGDRFFVVHFRGGGSEALRDVNRDEFLRHVKQSKRGGVIFNLEKDQ